MRIKTYLAAFTLFLCVLFVSVGVVSRHMTRSTTHMLRDKGAREFQTIRTTLALDMAAISARFPEGGADFHLTVNHVFNSHVIYYRRNNIGLTLRYIPGSNDDGYAHAAFEKLDSAFFVLISGSMPEPFASFRLSYTLDITENINDMQQIQRFLWVTSIVVSLIAAVFLYIILLKIFKPLEVVSRASGQVAAGKYSERIAITGQGELADVATAFNKMAAQIEGQINQLAEEAQRKQQFVDNFAHEIRTPLTSIYGYAEYLQKTKVGEAELIDSASYIMSEANHMKNVANSLLELATLRDYQPNRLPIYIPELFEDISKSLEKLLAERGVRLICQAYAYSLLAQVDLIKTLLLNLCTNAIASCESGVGEIRMTADKDDSKVIITVADNGCGIPEDMLAKVAEPFFRVDKARSRNHGGVGLGLALCKQIADVHDAEMVISSALGHGTEFKLTFTTP